MTNPQRIQRRRDRGWRTPLCSCGCGKPARYVGRPSKWGNMFRPELRDNTWCVVDENSVTYWPAYNNQQSALIKAVSLYHSEVVSWSERHMQLPELRGHDLVCWCSLDSPCHADVLLKLSNWETT